MTFVWRAALVMCIIFAGCLLGILLQHSLPSQHLAAAKSAITTIQGLVGLLLALVLGLLVWTSYEVYSQQQPEAHTLGSQILQLDLYSVPVRPGSGRCAPALGATERTGHIQGRAEERNQSGAAPSAYRGEAVSGRRRRP